ncbi:MAG: metallophosphoesterase [Methanomethylovorans sp.]|uniref:metallophosphoesterase n=1 Tax=Methanomethylovorans sp. TaxID=2758717 RepID=UPI003530D69E
MPVGLMKLSGMLPAMENILALEKPVITLRLPCMVVGDLHGNKKALDFIIDMWGSFRCPQLLFLGDYVDRGNASVDVLITLFEMKQQNWKDIILLRGNHESPEMNRKYGFFDEINRNENILSEVTSVFEKLPVAAIIQEKIFCVHGGIPGICNIEDISKDNSLEFLWNDPWEHNGMGFSSRGIGMHQFGRDILEDFLKLNHLSMMIRAHSALLSGYKWHFNKKLLSLFSTPEYCGADNQGSFALISESDMCIYVFGGKEGKYELIETSSINISHIYNIKRD